jgi:hypothetical protein
MKLTRATSTTSTLAVTLVATACVLLGLAGISGAVDHAGPWRVALQSRGSRPPGEAINGVISAASSSALLLSSPQSSTPGEWSVLYATSTGGFPVDLTVPGISQNQCGYFSTCLSGVVTDPSAGHSKGLVLLVNSMYAPASGLNPSRDITYVKYYDVATGEASKARPVPGVPAGSYSADYGQGTILTLLDNSTPAGSSQPVVREYRVNTATGQVLNHLNLAEGTGVTSVDGYLIAVNGSACYMRIYNALTLGETGQNNTCPEVASLNGLGGVVETKSLADGYYVTISNEAAVEAYHAATGQKLPVVVNISGPRSTMAVNWVVPVNTYSHTATGNAFSAYTIGTWSKGYTVSDARQEALDLNVVAMADNDVWATNSDQSIVFNAKTGTVILTSWEYSPLLGGKGWTVVESNASPTVGLAPEYLVQTSIPLTTVLG